MPLSSSGGDRLPRSTWVKMRQADAHVPVADGLHVETEPTGSTIASRGDPPPCQAGSIVWRYLTGSRSMKPCLISIAEARRQLGGIGRTTFYVSILPQLDEIATIKGWVASKKIGRRRLIVREILEIFIGITFPLWWTVAGIIFYLHRAVPFGLDGWFHLYLV